MPNPKPLALQWNQLALDAIKYTRTSPPLAARALAMLHTAMYDAWSVYKKSAISTTTAQLIKVLDAQMATKENIRKTFSYAAYRVSMDLFWLVLPPENKNMFRDLMCDCGYNPDDTTLDISTPQGVGNLVARLVIECHYGDGSNQLGTLHAPSWSDYTCYIPVNTVDKVNDIDHWQPLRVVVSPGETRVQNFLVPYWGLVKPFALDYNWQFRPGLPNKSSDPEFKEQAKEVLDISAGLTDEQKVIAEYWADGAGTYTPPGHWCEIAQFVAISREYHNSECIKLFFILCNAMLDASITCWECKRYYDYVRPVTAIRELYRGQKVQAWGGPFQGCKTINGEDWLPYIATPPFAEHVSGHSNFSRAAAVILSCYTGSDKFGGYTIFEKGCSSIEPDKTPQEDIKLDWPTFTDAAEQAGMSRLYGGIHFMLGNLEGLKLGEAIGQNAWEKAQFYFNS
jgi:hypothetical protein